MSYLRDSGIHESLPSIRRSGTGSRSAITTIEDMVDSERHVRYSNVYDRPTSPTHYPRPPSASNIYSRSHVANSELQEQISFLREELNKKDRLIQNLASVETPRTKFDFGKIEETYSNDKLNALAAARSDVAALQVKNDGLFSENRELKGQLEEREEKIRTLKLEIEIARENEAKQVAISSTLRQKVAEFESEYGSLEGAASRGELAIQSLQTQLKDSNERILELESRLRRYVAEKDSVEQEKYVTQGKITDIMTRFRKIILVDETEDIDIDQLVIRVQDVVSENATLRAKIYSMKDYVNSAEMETKACRETIMRLVAEAEKEQKASTRYGVELDNLRVERDTAIARQKELEGEITILRERLESLQRSWSSTRKELDEREARYTTFEREVRDSSKTVRTLELQLKGFKEQLASLLSVEGVKVEAYEESIKEHLKHLLLAFKEKKQHIHTLDTKVNNLTGQLEKHYELQRSAESRAGRVEGDFVQMKNRLRQLEDELATADAVRDGMRKDKEIYMRLVERLAEVLGVQIHIVDVGYDMAVDTLLARAEQLLKGEQDAIQDKKTHIFNLQRKLKAQKEQLESRDLHIDLLRKKITALEERALGKTDMERERDEEAMKNKKLQKLVERYKADLHEIKLEMNTLKCQVLESTDLRSRSLEQEKAIDDLEAKVGQLERIREKQATKITSLKDNLETTVEEISTKKESINQTIQALSSELRTTKVALDEMTKRERQLLDLRQVIARMLGLDINTLAVPDYEIIARLEKLILAQQASGSNMLAMEHILEDMGEGFRRGYLESNKSIIAAPPAGRARPVTRTTTIRTRARSASPAKRRDARAY